MKQRLQVLFDETELRQLRQAAKRQRLTTAEWVRRQLRDALAAEARTDTGARLGTIRNASQNSFPTGDLDEMLADIGRGYLEPGT